MLDAVCKLIMALLWPYYGPDVYGPDVIQLDVIQL